VAPAITPRTISAAAGSVDRIQPGKSTTTTTALATQANAAEAGIAPCRREERRRKQLAQ
jgi:hypothetical protein